MFPNQLKFIKTYGGFVNEQSKWDLKTQRLEVHMLSLSSRFRTMVPDGASPPSAMVHHT